MILGPSSETVKPRVKVPTIFAAGWNLRPFSSVRVSEGLDKSTVVIATASPLPAPAPVAVKLVPTLLFAAPI